MKRLSLLTLLLCLCLHSLPAQPVWNPDNGDGTFTNPILWGDWPDPDIIRVGSKFYMVSTSMHYVPGSPVLQSSDLVNFSKSDEGIGGTADFNWFRFNNH